MARNPYQMDPFLAQGFSNLTKALIGDPETDYQVARTNLTQAQMGTEEARRVLLEAQTLSENELRDPRIQSEIAEAQRRLADAERLRAQGGLYDSQTTTENMLRPATIQNQQNIARGSLAAALLDEAKTLTEDRTRQPKINNIDAQAAERNAAAGRNKSQGGFFDAQADTEKQLLPGKLDQQGADAAKTFAEISKTNRQTNEVQSNIDLNEAKIAKENRIILNAGQTIRTTNKQTGKVETYTAPETVQVTLAPGEEAVVSKADGTQETFAHSQKESADPSDAKGRLELIDAQMAAFTEDGLFAEVPKGVMRRLQSGYTDYAEGLLRQADGTVDEEDEKEIQNVVAMIRDQLSQTYQGQTAVRITKGSNFDVPAFIINNLMQPNATLDPKIITKTYGFSLSQAERIINFVRAQ